MLLDSKGVKSYGRVAVIGEDKKFYTIHGANVISLSQEHGVLEMTPEVIESISIGDLLVILPIHSCTTANMIGEYLTLDGEVLEHM